MGNHKSAIEYQAYDNVSVWDLVVISRALQSQPAALDVSNALFRVSAALSQRGEALVSATAAAIDAQVELSEIRDSR